MNTMVSGFGIEKEVSQISPAPKKYIYIYCNKRERIMFEIKIKSRL